jgi:hypothetical protein
MRHAGSVFLELDPYHREPLDPQQPRRALLQGSMNLRRLDQARDLTFVTMNCFDNSHDHRGHGPLTSTTRPEHLPG